MAKKVKQKLLKINKWINKMNKNQANKYWVDVLLVYHEEEGQSFNKALLNKALLGQKQIIE